MTQRVTKTNNWNMWYRLK